jgi:hypothetical protein
MGAERVEERGGIVEALDIAITKIHNILEGILAVPESSCHLPARFTLKNFTETQ